MKWTDLVHGCAAAAIIGWTASSSPLKAETPECANLTPSAEGESKVGVRVEPEDLIRLRDIGSIRDFPESPAFSISPDGKMLAFQIRRADPVTNSFCLGMFVVSISPGAKPRQIDSGGAFIRWTSDILGKADFPSGIPKVITPRWSPDGKWIAFLKRVQGLTQVWIASVDGTGSRAITHSDVDVGDFRISPDGRSVVYSSRPALRDEIEDIDKEGVAGFLYDDRFSPVAQKRPIPRPVPTLVTALDIATRVARPATEVEISLLQPNQPPTAPQPISTAQAPSGRKAWISPNEVIPPTTRLIAEMRSGGSIVCHHPECADAGNLVWWTADSRRVRYLRSEGWGQSVTSIYEWTPGPIRPVRLYATDDLLTGCKPLQDNLVCLRESSLRPRHIVLIDPAKGRSTILFDPNRDFGRLMMGRAERMVWKNAIGIETFGDLVYPIAYKPGRTYPLIVVQYQSRGFLRGGTGDEYPIQAFAGRGYAVLSIQRPQAFGYLAHPKSWDEVERLNVDDFSDRRSVLSSIEAGVNLLIDRGIVDGQRVGITGLSDGASTVQFAALNSSMFKAGVMSSCCWERSQAAVLGPTIGRMYRDAGWPSITDKGTDFWPKISFAQNPGRVAFPILMQVSDDEYLAALEGYTALREAGRPVDLFVFPDEHHIKWQPSHRLAVYRRAIAWFDFWLKDIGPDSSILPEDTKRWQDQKHRGLALSRR
ncbi:Atxe2 family lasso peptide isopeptidase [Novosphingobium percolationis]|uniref:Atxe2 family lasso peptide isopeptidase n=1 Tax=Novosphingobium percolationis TaxID=2871811 RepID=UPI001CD39CA4|nr:Atxe2 family lasso peptide isopeptidase [Novosphingobium percolationis]